MVSQQQMNAKPLQWLFGHLDTKDTANLALHACQQNSVHELKPVAAMRCQAYATSEIQQLSAHSALSLVWLLQLLAHQLKLVENSF
jgi:hypothetical protein